MHTGLASRAHAAADSAPTMMGTIVKLLPLHTQANQVLSRVAAEHLSGDFAWPRVHKQETAAPGCRVEASECVRITASCRLQRAGAAPSYAPPAGRTL